MPPPRTAIASLAIGVATTLALPMSAATAHEHPERRDLHKCAHARSTCEGRLSVPLNWSEPDGKKIDVAFTFVPRKDTSRPATGTVLANPGGPGPVTDSADSMEQTLGTALERKNLLLVDPRGLGKSSPLTCRRFDGRVPAKVRECTERLGDDIRYFNSAQSVADVDAVRDAVGVDELTWWAQSYGTVFAVAYATRFPDHVAAVYLNSATGFRDDGYTDPTMTADLHNRGIKVADALCQESAACRQLPGDTRDQLSRLTERLRADPDPAVSFPELSQLVVASTDSVTGRELSAAVAGYLDGDKAPLRRLAAEYEGVEKETEQFAKNPAYPGQLTYYCNDAKYPYDRHASAAEKHRQNDAYNERHLVTPFRAGEVLTGANFDEVCPSWPTPGETPPVPPNAEYPDVPTLVVNGAQDVTTPPEGAADTAHRFPHATFVSIPGGVHGNGLGVLGPYSDCVVSAMRDFVSKPRYLFRHPTCDGTSYRSLGSFPPTTDAVAQQVHGGDLTAEQRASVGVAYATVADAVARRNPTNRTTAQTPEQQALRGGTVKFDDKKQRITLDGARYVNDARVDGYASYGDQVAATVQVTTDDGTKQPVELHWTPFRAEDATPVTGTINGQTFTAYAVNRP